MKPKQGVIRGCSHKHIHVYILLYIRVYMYIPTTPAQLMRHVIGRNMSCALGDCLISGPKGRSLGVVPLDLLIHILFRQDGDTLFTFPREHTLA